MTTEKIDVKEFEYYLVFMDDRSNYVTAYGYNNKPAIIEFKYALETLSEDQELIAAIPDFKKIIDYICFDVMPHKDFIKYMISQEEKMQKEEKKRDKKDKKKTK